MPEGSVSVAEAGNAQVVKEAALTIQHDAVIVDLAALLAAVAALKTALTGAGVTDIATMKTAVTAVTLPTMTSISQ
jgi:hypothetical protein